MVSRLRIAALDRKLLRDLWEMRSQALAIGAVMAAGVVVLEALARVNTELGTTTIVITHNAAIAAMADRVIRLADGRIAGVEERTGTKLAPRQLSW